MAIITLYSYFPISLKERDFKTIIIIRMQYLQSQSRGRCPSEGTHYRGEVVLREFKLQ